MAAETVVSKGIWIDGRHQGGHGRQEKEGAEDEEYEKLVWCSQDYIDGPINTNVCCCGIKTFQITG